MQKLHLVGLTTDRRGLIFSSRRGTKSGSFVVLVDRDLLDAVAHLAASESGDGSASEEVGRETSSLSVRDVQALLRRGRTIEQVAAAAGVSSHWVGRFAAPVLAERNAVLDELQLAVYEAPRKGPSGTPFGEAIFWHLRDKGVPDAAVVLDEGWAARQIDGDEWAVTLVYRNRARRHEARWRFNRRSREVVADNRLAAELAYREPPTRPAGTRRAGEIAVHRAAGGTAARRPSRAAASSRAKPAGRAKNNTKGNPTRATAAKTKATAARVTAAKAKAAKAKAKANAAKANAAKAKAKAAKANAAKANAAKAAKANAAKANAAKANAAKANAAKANAAKANAAKAKAAKATAAKRSAAKGTAAKGLASKGSTAKTSAAATKRTRTKAATGPSRTARAKSAKAAKAAKAAKTKATKSAKVAKSANAAEATKSAKSAGAKEAAKASSRAQSKPPTKAKTATRNAPATAVAPVVTDAGPVHAPPVAPELPRFLAELDHHGPLQPAEPDQGGARHAMADEPVSAPVPAHDEPPRRRPRSRRRSARGATTPVAPSGPLVADPVPEASSAADAGDVSEPSPLPQPSPPPPPPPEPAPPAEPPPVRRGVWPPPANDDHLQRPGAAVTGVVRRRRAPLRAERNGQGEPTAGS